MQSFYYRFIFYIWNKLYLGQPSFFVTFLKTRMNVNSFQDCEYVTPCQTLAKHCLSMAGSIQVKISEVTVLAPLTPGASEPL